MVSMFIFDDERVLLLCVDTHQSTKHRMAQIAFYFKLSFYKSISHRRLWLWLLFSVDSGLHFLYHCGQL